MCEVEFIDDVTALGKDIVTAVYGTSISIVKLKKISFEVFVTNSSTYVRDNITKCHMGEGVSQNSVTYYLNGA